MTNVKKRVEYLISKLENLGHDADPESDGNRTFPPDFSLN